MPRKSLARGANLGWPCARRKGKEKTVDKKIGVVKMKQFKREKEARREVTVYSETWQALEKRGYDRAFRMTIDGDLKDPATQSLRNMERTIAWITPNWIIILFRNGSFIRPASSLARVHEDTLNHWSRFDRDRVHDRKHSVTFHFKDGTTERIRISSCGIENRIASFVSRAMPDVHLG